jgi:hypothetical protein
MNRRQTIHTLALTLGLVLGSARAPAAPARRSADVVREWNTSALDAVRTTRASDAQAARLYAMLNVAMYDAVNGILWQRGRQRDHALVPPNGAPRQGDLVAAAAAAAHGVLVAAVPAEQAQLDAQLASDLSALGNNGSVSAGRAWGEAVAQQVTAAREGDGATPEETGPAGAGPGQFRATWTGAQFRHLLPFAIVDPNVYVSAGPPSLTSVDYAAAFAEVKLLGNAATSDPQKLATFQFWNLPAGSDQPPGAWVQVALTVAASRSLAMEESTRLLALVSMATADTVAPTYTTKFVFNAWRPTTAIREADTDDNPDTTADPSWAPRGGGIGGNPEHWSGHSVFSAAAAAVLAGYFCNDAISFSLATDSSPGSVARTYPSFSAAATEAGKSRVFGGVHFEFSNQAGLAAGRAIAQEVLERKLLLQHGPTHFGSCPL